MSWQEYIDGNMMAENKLQHAAILGKEDGAVWACSENFPTVDDAEFANLMAALGNPTEKAISGIFLGGTKYFYLRGTAGELLIGKIGSGGICIRATEQCLLVGIYGEGTVPSECNLIVENLGDYLQEAGY
eukprot:TRINITY_DN1591_c0_g1_i1.p3 TRINITY_DN1591_c0_g1~~TRINITY_DN1591_c0_g1_i1.p3  ORF type:complete len:130 (-),score=34.40 TRINITY_DN1591_c0_g1_i1:293-682(-)